MNFHEDELGRHKASRLNPWKMTAAVNSVIYRGSGKL